MVKALSAMFFLIAWFGLQAGAVAGITAGVNRNHIDRTDSLILDVQINGNIGTQSPDFSPLNQDWRIITTSRQLQINQINGRANYLTGWRLTLAPKREGTLEIPALSWRNDRSQPIIVRVSPIPESLQQRLSKAAFFRTSVSSEIAWIQSQIVYQVALYHTQEVRFRSNPFILPKLPGTIVQPLTDASTDRELIDGVRYTVFRRSYAIFPQASGYLDIPPERCSGFIYLSQNNNNRKSIDIQSSGHRLKVLPKPAEYPADTAWLPASDVQLIGRWQGAESPLYVGDAATLSLEMTVQGMAASALPELPLPDTLQGRIYSHPSQSDEQIGVQGITSRTKSTLAVIPSQAGSLSLPPISVTWWDTQHGRLRQTTLDIEKLDVSANPDAPVTGTQPPPQTVGSSWDLWRWSTLVLSIAWVFTLIYTLRLRTQVDFPAETPSDPRRQKSWRMLATACRQADATAIRQALDIWAHEQRPEAAGSALAELIQHDQEGRQLIESLNRYLYQDSNTAFDADAILSWAKQRQGKDLKEDVGVLAPLYPTT